MPDNNLFGSFNDQDASLQSKAGGVFGLNQGAFLTKLEYNPNGGKDGAALDCFDLAVQINDREYRNRFFDVTSVYDNEAQGPRELDMTNEADVALYKKEINQIRGVMTSAAKAVGVTQENIDTAFSTPVSTFIEWGKILCSLLPDDFDQKSLDAFLEYQYSIKSGNDRTYLQLPKNMKGGPFLCPHQVPEGGVWKPIQDPNGLRYEDAKGNEHPFTRNARFMEGNKANQQGVDNTSTGSIPGTLSSGASQKTTW